MHHTDAGYNASYQLIRGLSACLLVDEPIVAVSHPLGRLRPEVSRHVAMVKAGSCTTHRSPIESFNHSCALMVTRCGALMDNVVLQQELGHILVRKLGAIIRANALDGFDRDVIEGQDPLA